MYKLIAIFDSNKQMILRTADNAYIPMDEANTDYQAYLAWVEAGGQPLPAENT
jgi:hypothetical protein